MCYLSAWIDLSPMYRFVQPNLYWTVSCYPSIWKTAASR